MFYRNGPFIKGTGFIDSLKISNDLYPLNVKINDFSKKEEIYYKDSGLILINLSDTEKVGQY